MNLSTAINLFRRTMFFTILKLLIIASEIKLDSIDDENIIVSSSSCINCIAFVPHVMVRKSNRNEPVKQIDGVFLVPERVLNNGLVRCWSYTQHVNGGL